MNPWTRTRIPFLHMTQSSRWMSQTRKKCFPFLSTCRRDLSCQSLNTVRGNGIFSKKCLASIGITTINLNLTMKIRSLNSITSSIFQRLCLPRKMLFSPNPSNSWYALPIMLRRLKLSRTSKTKNGSRNSCQSLPILMMAKLKFSSI